MFDVKYGLNKLPDKNKKEVQRFFLMSLTGKKAEKSPRLNVSFVLDKSGSMDGTPIESLKSGLKRSLDVFTENDRISIVLFDSMVETLLENTRLYGPDKKKVKRLINNIDAMGGTCIDEGLEIGLKEIQKVKLQDYVNWIILLTDGKNDHGSDEHALEVAKNARELGISIFTIGFGKHWSPTLLEKISDITKGEMYHVQDPKELKEIFTEKATKIRKTVAKNVEITVDLYEGVNFSEITPAYITKPQIVPLEPVLDVDQFIIEVGDIYEGKTKDILFQLFMKGNQKYLFDFKISYYDTEGQRQEMPWEKGVVPSLYEDPDKVSATIDRLSVYLQSEIVNDLLEGGAPEQALTLLQTMQLTATKLNDDELKTIIEQNVTKVQDGIELSDEDLIKTKMFTKTVIKDD